MNKMKRKYFKISALTVLIAGSIVLPSVLIVNNISDTTKTPNSNTAINNANPNNTMKNEVVKQVRIKYKTNIGSYNMFNHMPSMMPFIKNGKVYSSANNETGGLIVYDDQGAIVNSFSGSEFTPEVGAHVQLIETVVPSSKGTYLYISTLDSVYSGSGSSITRTDSYSTIYKWDWNNNVLTKITNLKDLTNYTNDSYMMKVIPGTTEDKDQIFGYFSDYRVGDKTHATSIRMCENNYFVVSADQKTRYAGTLYYDHISGTNLSFYKRPTDLMIVSKGANSYQLLTYFKPYNNHDGSQWHSIVIAKLDFSIDPSNKLAFASSAPVYYNGGGWQYGLRLTQPDKVIMSTDTIVDAPSTTNFKNFNVNYYNAHGGFGSTATVLKGDYSLDYGTLGSYHSAGIHNSINYHILEQDGTPDGNHVYELYKNSRSIATNVPNNSINLNHVFDTNYHIDAHSTIDGFTYTDANKSKLLVFDSAKNVIQYDTTNQTYTLKKGIEFEDASNVPMATKHKLPSEVLDSQLKTMVKQVGLTTNANHVRISKSADDSTGKLTVNIYVAGDDGQVYNKSETYTGFLTNDFTSPNWQANWLSNTSSSIDKLKLPTAISDSTIKGWVTIGSSLAYYKAKDPVIIRDDTSGSITVTLSYDNLPPSVQITYSKTYTGFYDYSDYSFDSTNWKDVTPKDRLPSQVTDTDIANIINPNKPKAIKAITSQPPLVTIKNDATGVIEVSYDYSNKGLPAGINLHPSHTYKGFKTDDDYTVKLDNAKAAALSKKQLPSVVNQTQAYALLNVPTIMSGLPNLSHTVDLKPNDDTGELAFTVTYKNAPVSVQSVYTFTIKGFQNTSQIQVLNWGVIQDKNCRPSDLALNSSTVISDMITNNEIVLGAALKVLPIPTIKYDPNDANGSLNVTLSYTINGKAYNFTNQYRDFYTSDAYSISIDATKLDKNKLASQVDKSEIKNNLTRSAAINKYGLKGESIVLTHDDATGVLIAKVSYTGLGAGIPNEFSLNISGYNKTSDYGITNWGTIPATKKTPRSYSTSDIDALITKGSAFAAATPILTLSYDDVHGSITASITASAPTGWPLATKYPRTFTHTYEGLYNVNDYYLNINSSALNVNTTFASKITKADITTAILKPSAALKTEGVLVSSATILTPDDDNGTLIINVSYTMRAKQVPTTYTLIVSGFLTKADYQVKDWADSNIVVSTVEAKTITSQNILDDINNSTIKLNAGLDALKGSLLVGDITVTHHNSIGSIDVEIDFKSTDVPLPLTGKYFHTYNGFKKADAGGVTLDPKKFDKNKYASKVTQQNVYDSLLKTGDWANATIAPKDIQLISDNYEGTLLIQLNFGNMASGTNATYFIYETGFTTI